MTHLPPPPPPMPVMARASLPVNRTLLKYILLGFITFGIYMVYGTARAGEDLNLIASRWDNRRSMNFWLMALLLGPLTLGIGLFVWWHNISDRIGNEQQRRGLPRTMSAADFWLWDVLGSLIVVGPYIFMYRWLHSMNALCADFNARG